MTPLVKDIIMSSTRMPALFLGHGSPMNVLEDNLYTRSWQTLGQHLVELLAPVPVTLDKEAWGFDHGSWGVLIKMYPDADIPMVQLSIDSSKPAAWHFEMGRKLGTTSSGELSRP